MATMFEWMNAANPGTNFPIPKTTETYSKIKALGLETVSWEEFSELNNSSNNLQKISSFIRKNKPCLFIYDPKTLEVSKGYLFNVRNFSQVIKWVTQNSNNIEKYNYLITTQIDNPGFGFVGSFYSDGKGNAFSETLHRPGVSNQRELSQSENKNITPYEDFFMISEGELISTRGTFLSHSSIIELADHYLNKEGYFEFVKGIQKGITGIYTTGYEEFENGITFPDALHRELHYSDLSLRLNAKIKKGE